MKATERKESRAEKIRQHITANPTKSVSDIAKEFGTTYQIVYLIKRGMQAKKVTVSASEVIAAQKAGVSVEEVAKKKIKAKTKRKVKVRDMKNYEPPKNIDEMIDKAQTARKKLAIEMIEPKSDPVNHPAHYKVGGIETIDFIEAKGLNYHLGNVVKYVTRADHKGDRLENLRKAQWYLNREIEHASQGA